jgi:anti-anti-sigma factor
MDRPATPPPNTALDLLLSLPQIVEIGVEKVEIDFDEAPAFERELTALINAAVWNRNPEDVIVIVDLSRIRLLTAAGVEVLMRSRERLERHGIGLLLAGASGGVARVLDICGLTA